MRTVLFVGAGRVERRAIVRAKKQGLRVVVVDGDSAAPGVAEADIAKQADAGDVRAVLKATARLKLDGVLALGRSEFVPAAAALAEARGLRGIGVETAHTLESRIALRRGLAEAGVPQPHFAAVRTLLETRRAAAEVGFPAVLRPADAGARRGVVQVASLDDVDAHLHQALAASRSGEAILEELVRGVPLTAVVAARGSEALLLLLSGRHLYPPAVEGAQRDEAGRVAVHAVHALGLRDTVAVLQLTAHPEGQVHVADCAVVLPGTHVVDLVDAAVGVDVLDLRLRLALGDDVPDEVVRPRFSRPHALRFLTAGVDGLPVGRVGRVGPLDKVLAFPGVVQADVYLQVGETIRPVRLDGDRRGYVIAVADTNLEALDRAEAAAGLVDVEVEPA